eukprot:scaffold387_cov87-Skeletonema_marinoi.AAC.1
MCCMIDRVAADTWCPVEYYSRRESPPMNHSIIICICIELVWRIALFSTCPQLCDRPRRTKDSPGAQLHPGSRGRLYVQVEEKIFMALLWRKWCHGAVDVTVVELFDDGKNTLWGLLCFTSNAG